MALGRTVGKLYNALPKALIAVHTGVEKTISHCLKRLAFLFVEAKPS